MHLLIRKYRKEIAQSGIQELVTLRLPFEKWKIATGSKNKVNNFIFWKNRFLKPSGKIDLL